MTFACPKQPQSYNNPIGDQGPKPHHGGRVRDRPDLEARDDDPRASGHSRAAPNRGRSRRTGRRGEAAAAVELLAAGASMRRPGQPRPQSVVRGRGGGRALCEGRLVLCLLCRQEEEEEEEVSLRKYVKGIES